MTNSSSPAFAADSVAVAVEVVDIGPNDSHAPGVRRSIAAAARAIYVAGNGHAGFVGRVAAGCGFWRPLRDRTRWCPGRSRGQRRRKRQGSGSGRDGHCGRRQRCGRAQSRGCGGVGAARRRAGGAGAGWHTALGRIGAGRASEENNRAQQRCRGRGGTGELIHGESYGDEACTWDIGRRASGATSGADLRALGSPRLVRVRCRGPLRRWSAERGRPARSLRAG